MFKTGSRTWRQTRLMIIRDYFPTAAKEVGEIARGAAPADLTAPTPCADFDLKTLINHVIGTTGALALVGRRAQLDPEDPYGARNDATGGDWAGQLAARTAALADVWSRPEAWDGTVSMAGQELPATLMGELSMAEMLLHGWDLARGTGRQLTVPEDVGRELLRHIDETAEWGRSMGAYGPPVAVDGRAGATAFERALAAAGRDPAWVAG